MAIYLNSEKQSRFNQLIALFSSGDISDEQEGELIALRRELQNNKAERIDRLTSIKAQIAELGVSVAELYSEEDISAAAQKSGLLVSRATPATKRREKGSRPSDSNEVLLILPKEPGERGPADWRYHRGRIFERAGGTVSNPWQFTLRQFPSKLLKVGASADSLRPFFTPAGVAYFATEQGCAELVRLVEVTVAARVAMKVA